MKQEFVNCIFIVIEHIQLPASFGYVMCSLRIVTHSKSLHGLYSDSPLEETEEQYCLEIGSFLLLFVEMWTDHKRKKQFDCKG